MIIVHFVMEWIVSSIVGICIGGCYLFRMSNNVILSIENVFDVNLYCIVAKNSDPRLNKNSNVGGIGMEVSRSLYERKHNVDALR